MSGKAEQRALQLENEHGCRLEDPDKFSEFRRVSGKGDAPDIIVGITDQGSVAQSFRFPTDTFPEERARKICRERGGKFDAAAGGDESEERDQQEDQTISTSTVKRRHETAVSAEPERQEFQGREHLVLPMTSLQEMVIDGELISEEALAESVAHGKWDGRPIVLGHNTTEDGAWQSATDIEFADENQIGHTRNTELDDGRLRTEAWIDVEMAKRSEKGQLVLDRIENGDLPIEVSAAYETTLLDESGDHNGKQFNARQAEIFPDHVAALPSENERGKCSVEDGCGMGRMNAEGIHVHGLEVVTRDAMLAGPSRAVDASAHTMALVLSESRRPSFSGNAEGEVPDDWPPSLGDFIRANDWDAETWDDLTDDQKQQVVDTTLLGEAADTFAGSMMFPVVDEDGNLRENALVAVLGGRGSQADIPDDALESARRMARGLLEDVFGRDVEENQQDDGDTSSDDEQNNEGSQMADEADNADDTMEAGQNIAGRLRDVLTDLLTTPEDKDATMANQIEALAEGDNPFDRETLEAMSEEEVGALADQFLANEDADGADSDDDSEDRDLSDEDADDAGDDADDDSRDLSDEDADDEDNTRDNASDEDADDAGDDTGGRALSEDERELLERLLEEKKDEVKDREARKNELVDDLDERDDVSVPSEDLKAMSVEGLEALRDQVDREATFVGRGGRAQRSKSGKSYFDENPRTPGVLLKDESDE